MRITTVRAALVAGVWTAAALLQAASSATVQAPLPKAAQKAPYQVGKAAWYCQRFHGRKTASGELFDMFQLTAAHRKLPLGSVIKVTNLTNQKAIVVRINDRGPWGQPRRILDLSYEASRRLGMLRAGVAQVRLDVVSQNTVLALTTD